MTGTEPRKAAKTLSHSVEATTAVVVSLCLHTQKPRGRSSQDRSSLGLNSSGGLNDECLSRNYEILGRTPSVLGPVSLRRPPTGQLEICKPLCQHDEQQIHVL